jgi:WD40 repeat protein
MELDYVSPTDDLSSGRMLQRSLLPQSLPVYPGLDIAAEVWTAVDLGGDYYQFLEQPGILSVAVADSSGKSVAGAIHAALFKGQLDAYAQQGKLQNPIAVLESLNQLLCRARTEDAVALSYGVLDLGSYDLRIGSAGMPGPIIYHAATGECEEVVSPGIALGRFIDTPYRAISRSLSEDDVVIFYSDGLSEAINHDGIEFGELQSNGSSPLMRAIRSLGHLSATEIRDGLKVVLGQFSGRELPEDDVSIVVIKLNQKVPLSQLMDCPYQEAIRIWRRSEEKDESALLRGTRLDEALAWAEGRNLSPIDREFLEASRRVNEKEQLQAERAAAADRLEKLSQDLAKSLQSEHMHRLKAEMGELNERIVALTMSSEALYLSHNHLEALIASVIAGVQLKRLTTQLSGESISLKANTQIRTITALEQVVYGIHEYNRFEGHGYWVNGVAFRADGKVLASGSSDRTIKIWSVDGTLLQTLFGHTNWVTSVAFSPDGKILASGSRDNTVRLWLADEHGVFADKPYEVLKGHDGPVLDVSFSPNGHLIASASEDTTVKLWKPNGANVKTLRGGHERWVNCVAFSPDGRIVASGSADRSIIFWNTEGVVLKTLKGHDSFIESISFEPSGQALASASRDKTVKIWGSDGVLLQTLTGHDNRVWGVSFSPDGQHIASCGFDRTVRIWNIEGEMVSTFRGHGDVVNKVRFSPDGKTLISASRDTTLKLWSLKGSPLKTLAEHTDDVNCATFSSNGYLIATGGRDSMVYLWQFNGNLVAKLEGHKNAVNSVCFSPDGSILVSGGIDSSFSMWNCSKGTLIDTFGGHRAEIHDIVFRSDGQVFATCSADNTIRIWQADGTWLQTLNGHTAEVYSIAFSPDGSKLVSVSKDKIINIWNWDGTMLHSFEGHSAEIFSVCFSPDGQKIATGSMDQSVRIWTVDGSLLKTLNGHSAEVTSVCFSPDGKSLASGSEDTTIQLWGMDGTLLRTFTGHSAPVKSVSFMPGGKAMISASADRKAILWNLDLENLVMRGCSWLQEYLRNNSYVSEEDRRNCIGGCKWIYQYMRSTASESQISQISLIEKSPPHV